MKKVEKSESKATQNRKNVTINMSSTISGVVEWQSGRSYFVFV